MVTNNKIGRPKWRTSSAQTYFDAIETKMVTKLVADAVATNASSTKNDVIRRAVRMLYVASYGANLPE